MLRISDRFATVILAAFAFALAGCSSPAPRTAPQHTGRPAHHGARGAARSEPDIVRETGPRATVTDKLTVRLGRSAGTSTIDRFQRTLDRAYDQTIGAGEQNFIYSIAPSGAVNPFSEVEVTCLTEAAPAHGADRVCKKFFDAVKAKYPAK